MYRMKAGRFIFILMIILVFAVPAQLFSGGLKACPIKANEEVKEIISLGRPANLVKANCPSNVFELLARNHEASLQEGFMPGTCCLAPAIMADDVFDSLTSTEPAWLISEQLVRKRPLFIQTQALLI